MTLYVLSNKHLRTDLTKLKKGGFLVVQNKLSYVILRFVFNSININIEDITIYSLKDFINKDIKLRFDNILGNPPYQDGKQNGGQNKIYNQISRKAISLLSENGVINFITPIAVTRPSKRFSLMDYNVKSIDFTIDGNFNIGQTVCSWVIDKNYSGGIKIITNDTIKFIKQGSLILRNETNSYLIKQYIKFKKISKKDRFLQQNNFGSAYSKETKKYKFAVNCLYSNKEPIYYKLKKLIISYSKAYKRKNVIISEDDYPTQYVFTTFSNDNEKENILSFLFSDYFIGYIKTIKEYERSTSYEALKYLPKFDKTKHWTNDEVKEFFEQFI